MSQINAQALQRKNGSAQVRSATKSKKKPSIQRTVLVVDDSATIRQLVTTTLERRGYKVVVAPDGLDALAKMNSTVPDVIFLDITMPRLDGYQVCKIIKSNEETKHIPVIMLSGKDGFFDKVKGKMAGATEYITKPFKPSTLLRAAKKHIKAQRSVKT